MEFYLGTHYPSHLYKTDVPLFISRRQLENRVSDLECKGRWALDSGGFTELKMNGKWTISSKEYIDTLTHIKRITSNLSWAAQQDWMCEPDMLEITGLTVKEHQKRTVDNYLELRNLSPPVKIIPVLQGWSLDQYKDCFERFEAEGVDLRSEPLVGIGSVCRRQSSAEIEKIISFFHAKDLRLHGFGVKTLGLKKYGELLSSADSMAWSFGARRTNDQCSHHKVVGFGSRKVQDCRNCLKYALEWRDKLLSH